MDPDITRQAAYTPRINEALTLAQELSNPFSLGWALSFAGVVHMYRGEEQAVQAYAEACIAHATEQGFPHWLAQGIMQRGWVLAQQGEENEGLAQMKEGFAAWRATGIELGLSYWSTLLVEVYQKAGQVKEGLGLLAKALAAVEKSGEGPWEAELYRLKGEQLLKGEGEMPVLSKVEGMKDEQLPEDYFLNMIEELKKRNLVKL